jgi:TalC/MipB family fructose-6-phosphate aldolase
MELYLDSVNLDEIKAASQLGYLTGLTTTPTFMFRDGIKDIDAAMLNISKMVDVLQVEALGKDADEIVAEAERLVALGLSPKKTVFKIPISLEGTKACKRLIDKGMMVNLHLVYSLQQAYMAFSAGATYVCPLVGRLQDQGHDALGLVQDCVETVEKYGYNSKVMFSSVRYAEHIKNALHLGVHTITIPWKVMKALTENHFTRIGTEEFITHTNLLTTKVGEIARTEDIFIAGSATVMDALLAMSKSKTGAILVTKPDQSLHRIFTDGDLRRLLEEKGEGIVQLKLADLPANNPHSIFASTSLMDAQAKFKETAVDALLVKDGDRISGLLDVQDVL